MAKNFTRTKENFICENCGTAVIGNGYTNHCPSCLYSKHVDINPGDRSENCGGLMKPVAINSTREGYRIHHVCTKCQFDRWTKSDPADDIKMVIEISKQGL